MIYYKTNFLSNKAIITANLVIVAFYLHPPNLMAIIAI